MDNADRGLTNIGEVSCLKKKHQKQEKKIVLSPNSVGAAISSAKSPKKGLETLWLNNRVPLATVSVVVSFV